MTAYNLRRIILYICSSLPTDSTDDSIPIALECLTPKYLEELDDAELQGQLLQCCRTALQFDTTTSSTTDTSVFRGWPTSGCQAYRVSDYVDFADFFKAVVVECNAHVTVPRDLNATHAQAYAFATAWETAHHAPWKRYAGKRTLSLCVRTVSASVRLSLFLSLCVWVCLCICLCFYRYASGCLSQSLYVGCNFPNW